MEEGAPSIAAREIIRDSMAYAEEPTSSCASRTVISARLMRWALMNIRVLIAPGGPYNSLGTRH